MRILTALVLLASLASAQSGPLRYDTVLSETGWTVVTIQGEPMLVYCGTGWLVDQYHPQHCLPNSRVGLTPAFAYALDSRPCARGIPLYVTCTNAHSQVGVMGQDGVLFGPSLGWTVAFNPGWFSPVENWRVTYDDSYWPRHSCGSNAAPSFAVIAFRVALL